MSLPPDLPPGLSDDDTWTERRRWLRVTIDAPARLRVPGGRQVAARLLDLSEGGARLAVDEPAADLPGRRIVVSGPKPLQHGYDAKVIAARGDQLHLAFDGDIAALGVLRGFIEGRAKPPRG